MLLARRDLGTLIGSLTQLGTIRLGRRTEGRAPKLKDFIPLASLDQIHHNIPGIEDIYPLAPLQHGLLFHNLYEPTSGTYFVQFHCTLQGDLDISAFERAWQDITQRHAILRTAFVWEGVSTPVQVVS